MADIALDLGEYGLAAHLYYLIGTGLSAKEYGDRNVLAHFLFSVEQLGVKAIKELFKGDHVRDFSEIQKQSERGCAVGLRRGLECGRRRA
jgi:hypothetical protein